MIHLRNQSNSIVIVIHEIYGINQHMESFCKKISSHGFDVICPNLLELEKPFDYCEEKIAYDYFFDKVGFLKAVQKIKGLLHSIQSEYEKIYIIGFSVGATIAWLCSEEDYLDGIVGYYGSRIRHYQDVVPVCPVSLFFPKEELSYDVDELISNLDKRKMDVYKFNGKHGFSDPFSPHFDEEVAREAFHKMLTYLETH